MMNKRMLSYCLLAGVTGLLVYFAPMPSEDSVEVAKAVKPKNDGRPGKISTQQAATSSGLALSNRSQFAQREDVVFELTSIDLTRASSWLPPPKIDPATLNLPPPKPVAPSLPFKYFGRMVDVAGKTILFVVNDQKRLLPVERGEVIESLYRVENISSAEIVFIYLPLEEKQVLPIVPAS